MDIRRVTLVFFMGEEDDKPCVKVKFETTDGECKFAIVEIDTSIIQFLLEKNENVIQA